MTILQPEIIGLILTMCAAGAVAGVTAGLFGIGGGFVVVPALLFRNRREMRATRGSGDGPSLWRLEKSWVRAIG